MCCVKYKNQALTPPPRGEDKASKVLPQSLLQPKTGAKKRHMCTTHDQTYRSGGQKIRVEKRSQTSSLSDFPEKQGKEADDTDPATSTATRNNA